jgi:hypothetical protein
MPWGRPQPRRNLLEKSRPLLMTAQDSGRMRTQPAEHYSHIRLKAEKAALDRLDGSGQAGSIKTAK